MMYKDYKVITNSCRTQTFCSVDTKTMAIKRIGMGIVVYIPEKLSGSILCSSVSETRLKRIL